MDFLTELFNNDLIFSGLGWLLGVIGVGWITYLLKGKKVVSKVIVYATVAQMFFEFLEALKLSVSKKSSGGKRLTAKEMDMLNETFNKVKEALRDAGFDYKKDAKPQATFKPKKKNKKTLDYVLKIGGKVISYFVK